MENWLLKRAQLSSDQPALYFQDHALTFKALANEVQEWAEKLNNLTLRPKSPIGLIGTNTKTTYCLILAIQQLGHPVALFNFRLSPAELLQQVQDAQPSILLVDDTLPQWQKLPESLSYQALNQQQRQSYPPIAEFDNETIADIMYTSGSTGRPKGVLQTFGNHFYSAIGTGLNFKLSSDDAWICAVPLFHISGLSILMRSLIYGLTVYLEPKFDAQRINYLLQQAPTTIVSVVPYMLKQLLATLPESAHYQSKFKGLFLGGGPIDRKTLEICEARQIPVVQSYGMTETASNVVALNFKDAPQKIGASGQALFPVQLRISPQGEIQLKSPTLAKGYLHQTAAFEQKFTTDHWFKTGDIGELDTQGFLYVKGRVDTMFISGGENIFPNEIEAIYSHYPGIQEIVVTHQKDPKWGAIPIALIIPEKGASLTAKSLTDFGREQLTHYKVPKAFYQLTQLPKTGNGKLNYAALNTLELVKSQQLS